jgi:hypothetical protein
MSAMSFLVSSRVTASPCHERNPRYATSAGSVRYRILPECSPCTNARSTHATTAAGTVAPGWLKKCALRSTLLTKARVRTVGVVEREIAAQPSGGVGHRVVGVQVHFLVLERAPEPFDENAVAPAAVAVHADADAVLEEEGREGRCRRRCRA